ncbi:hypothetical protein PENSPDRAFT_453728 [Peniophora sp. CONT]|nr:hypothetical protein PENSPDRAFT_453728 [Peniophora sp. CONT]
MPLQLEPHLDNYLGALFIGVMLSTAIYGVTCLQYYLYFAHYSSHDGLYVKALIVTLLVLDTAHATLLGVCYYYYSVTHFGDYDALERPHWSLLVQVGVGTVLSLLVQCFYAYRIHRIGNAILVPLVIVALSWGQEIAGGVLYMLHAFKVDWIPLTASTTSTAFTTSGLVCDVACDICIAVATFTYLYRISPGSMKNKAIGQLVLYSMNTCLVTSVCAAVCLVVWLTTSEASLIYAPFFFVLIRMYSCSLMTVMNSRENLLKKLRHSKSDPLETADMHPHSRTWGNWGPLRDTVSSSSQLPASPQARSDNTDLESQLGYVLSPFASPHVEDFQKTNWSVPRTVSTSDDTAKMWGSPI